MTKRIILLLTALTILLTLASCNGKSNVTESDTFSESDTVSESVSETESVSEAESTHTDDPSDEVFSPVSGKYNGMTYTPGGGPLVDPDLTLDDVIPLAPTIDDVVKLYKKASDVWGWFYICTLPTVSKSEYIDIDDQRYYPVDDITTLDELTARLKECFSDRLCTELIEERVGNGKQYTEIEGRLYVSPGARGSNIHARGSTFNVEKTGDYTALLTRNVDVYEYEPFSHLTGISPQKLELVWEGESILDKRWVFDTFTSPDSLYNENSVSFEYARPIADAFVQAERAAAWLWEGNKDIAYSSDDAITYNGATYLPLTENSDLLPTSGSASLDELRQNLSMYFDSELTEKLINTKVNKSGVPLFIEQDGVLYRCCDTDALCSYDNRILFFTGYSTVGDIYTVEAEIRSKDHEIIENVTYKCVKDGKYFKFVGDFPLPAALVNTAE